MAIITELLWVAMVLLFFGGCIAYAVRPHVGLDLLKRSAVLLAVVLVGPGLVTGALGQIPPWIMVLVGIAGSVGAYRYLSGHQAPKAPQHRHGPS